MDTIQIVMGGKELTFRVEFRDDCDAGLPWENSEGHGPVSEWTHRDKLPGEWILNQDRTAYRFYDYAEACKIARRDGWDAIPYNDGTESKRQQAAKAAKSNYEYLRAFCDNQWSYVGVVVTLLNDDGEETNVSDSLWCVETWGDNHYETARQIADELAHGYGTQWGEVDKTTFDYLTTGNN